MKSPRDSSDAPLVRLLCAGDPDAAQQLLAAHGDRVNGYLRRRFPTLDSAQIHDIFVDATLRLIDSFDPKRGSPGGWLVFLAHREAINVLRRQRQSDSWESLDPATAPAAPVGNPVDALITAERLAEIREALNDLAPLERAIIEADVEAGRTVDAASLASSLGTTEASIYATRRRARVKLIKRLQREGR